MTIRNFPLGIASFKTAKRFCCTLRKLSCLLVLVSNKSILIFPIFCILFYGCSIKKIAINSFANSLADGSSSVFASDDDHELVKDALPFALKTMEALLQTTPDNENLLIATASGFVQYGHAFVAMPANELEYENYTLAKHQKMRAKKLFIRGRDYALQVLELRYKNFYKNLLLNPVDAVKATQLDDVSALYWTGAAWGSALSVAKDDMTLIGDIPIISALMVRALELDESWQNGALHDFFMSFGGSEKLTVEEHFERSMELKQGKSIGPLVSAAEAICVKEQDYSRFKDLLNQALAFNVDNYPENRLANTLSQKKAAFLLDHREDLFYNLDE